MRDNKKFQFIYIVTSPSGKYYVGRHSTNDMDDGYLGSGKWISQIKDRSDLVRTVLGFYDNHEQLVEAERAIIETHIMNEDCMNFNNNPVGFGSGSYNPNHSSNMTPERFQVMSERVKGDKNPTKRKEVREKLSHSMKNSVAHATAVAKRIGSKASDETRKKISEARSGATSSDETKAKISKTLKDGYSSGKLTPVKAFLGRTHTEEVIQKMKESARNLEKKECQFCGRLSDPGNHNRWHGYKCNSNPDKN